MGLGVMVGVCDVLLLLVMGRLKRSKLPGVPLDSESETSMIAFTSPFHCLPRTSCTQASPLSFSLLFTSFFLLALFFAPETLSLSSPPLASASVWCACAPFPRVPRFPFHSTSSLRSAISCSFVFASRHSLTHYRVGFFPVTWGVTDWGPVPAPAASRALAALKGRLHCPRFRQSWY